MRASAMLGPLGALLVLIGFSMASATQEPGARRVRGTNPRDYVAIGGTVFFSAEGEASGRELWKVEEGSSTAMLVRDIFPGSGSSNPAHLVNLNGTLFFSADDGTHGPELWKSDGTAGGTALVLDIRPGAEGSLPDSLTEVHGFRLIFRLAGLLYFTADDGSVGRELWRSDGTAEGTRLVKDISRGSEPSHLDSLTNVGGILFARTPSDLWRSDGTEKGTYLLRRRSSAGRGGSIQHVRDLVEAGGRLYFCAMDGSALRLWTSDGTQAGTRVVSRSATIDLPEKGGSLVANRGRIFFVGEDAIPKHGLFRSDGTDQGTLRVTPYEVQVWPPDFAFAGGRIYFGANDGEHGSEIWSAQAGGTSSAMIADLAAGKQASAPHELTAANGLLFFLARNVAGEPALFRTDGTAAGTSALAGTGSRLTDCSPGELQEAGGLLFFSCASREVATGTPAQEGDVWQGPWRTDGTAAGTVAITGISR